MAKLPKLREIRELNALSQAELAELAGVSRGTVIRAEAGEDTYPGTAANFRAVPG